MVILPVTVADAIERVWNVLKDRAVPKYLIMNDWSLLSKEFPNDYPILFTYATNNAMNYMMALFEGYEVEFNKDMGLAINNRLYVFFSDAVARGNGMYNYPITIQVDSEYLELSLEEVGKLQEMLRNMTVELGKVRK